jgi:hypothetical protein
MNDRVLIVRFCDKNTLIKTLYQVQIKDERVWNIVCRRIKYAVIVVSTTKMHDNSIIIQCFFAWNFQKRCDIFLTNTTHISIDEISIYTSLISTFDFTPLTMNNTFPSIISPFACPLRGIRHLLKVYLICGDNIMVKFLPKD